MQVRAREKKAKAIALFSTRPSTTRELQEVLGCSDNKARTLVNLLLKENLIEVSSWQKNGKSLARVFKICQKNRKPRPPVIKVKPEKKEGLRTFSPSEKVACYGIWGLA